MLLDTSGLLPLIFTNVKHRAVAVAEFKRPVKKLVTDFVLAELVALAHARRLSRSPVLEFIDDLQRHPMVTLIWNEPVRFHRSLDLLERRPDKTYSLCDAVSFIVMNDYGVTEALTTDRHFVQEGFSRLLNNEVDH